VFWLRLREKHVLDLSKIVDVVSKVNGVVGVFLFGSLARGDFDEFSDYDLLVVFEDRTVMWRSWDALFEAVGALQLNLHVVPETVDELKQANPVFLDDLFKFGKVLFARFPFEVFAGPIGLESYCLVVYEMSGLSVRDKMKVVYFLYRKGGAGELARVSGFRVGEGCLLVPSRAGDVVVEGLKGYGVIARKLETYSSGDHVKALFGKTD